MTKEDLETIQEVIREEGIRRDIGHLLNQYEIGALKTSSGIGLVKAVLIALGLISLFTIIIYQIVSVNATTTNTSYDIQTSNVTGKMQEERIQKSKLQPVPSERDQPVTFHKGSHNKTVHQHGQSEVAQNTNSYTAISLSDDNNTQIKATDIKGREHQEKSI